MHIAGYDKLSVNGKASMDLIVNFTPTGMIPTKEMTPHVPISVPEIVQDVQQAWEAGITMVHLHARDRVSGKPAYDADIYAELIEGIRKFAPELIIAVSLSGRNFPEFEKRAAPLELDGSLKPDMGSLTLSSINFNRDPSINSPEIIQQLAARMRDKKILPELEAFDAGMLNYARYLEKKGLLEAPHYVNLIVGNIACAQADLLHIGLMLKDLPEKSLWSLGGVGDVQLMVNSIAIATGGGVRVGLEDNIWFDEARTKPARNIDLIRRIKNIADANGRSIMKPGALRQLLKLAPGNGSYGLQ